MDDKFEVVNRELKYKGSIIEAYQDSVKLPNGNIAKWDYVHHRGAAAVVPVTAEGKILMVRQYRHSLERYTLEIPAGGLDSVDEPGEVCAKRELEEETGYRSENIQWLITVRTSVGFCNEKIEIYLARDLVMSEQNLDEDEFVSVLSYSIEELKEKIFSGEIEDSKTIAALFAYDTKMRE